MTKEWALSLAAAASGNSRCRRRKIGAVITNRVYDKVWSVGWIRSHQEPDCLAGGCPRGLLSESECPPYAPYGNCISEHAEMAAVDEFQTAMACFYSEAGQNGYGPDGWCKRISFRPLMTVTVLPCADCQRQLLRIGMIVQWPGSGGVWHELGGVGDATLEDWATGRYR